MANRKNLEMHIVSHTHWDREWRMSMQEFRMKLVECLDHLLEIMEKDPDYRYFTLDGQSILLEDYLEIRPENRERLTKFISEGRILAGPWYTLIDEPTLHGESIIRNLLMGHKIAEQLGRVMKVGYSISSFGHISQLPQIYLGFDIDNVIFSRGINQWQVKSEFVWEAPDGSQVLALHLPDDYTKSNWFYVVYRPAVVGMPARKWDYDWGTLGLVFHACDKPSWNKFHRLITKEPWPFDLDKAVEQVEQLKKETSALSTTSYLLFMDGVDHLEPYPLLPELIVEVNKRLNRDKLVHSNLPDYIKKVKAATKGKLQVKRGEMRNSTREGVHNPLLGHTLSGRIYLKQINQKVQTELIGWAEPMAAIAWTLGFPYPAPYLELSWKFLLQNHAHDCLAGCSIDEVHKDMEYRFFQSRMMAEELTQRAFWQVVPEIDNSDLDEQELALTIFNSLPFDRDEIVTLGIEIPQQFKAKGFVILDSQGTEVPYQPVSIEKTYPEMLNPHNCQMLPHLERYEVYLKANSLPALGYKTYKVRPLSRAKRYQGNLADSGNSMENEFLRLEINPDGTFNIIDKERNQTFSNCHYFTDGGDIGNAWIYEPPLPDEIISSLGTPAIVSLIENGPVQATFRIEYQLQLPEEAVPPLSREKIIDPMRGVRKRSQRKKLFVITSFVTLRKGARRVDITTKLNNDVKDHRLRVHFPSGITRAKVSAAAAPFDVIERPIKLPDTSGWIEQAYATHPQVGFVDVSDGKEGFAILSEGLPEFEVTDDEPRTIALTLLRCVGRTIGEDFSQRGGQCLGHHEFRYSIFPHAGTWDKALVFKEALKHNTPLKATISTPEKAGSPFHSDRNKGSLPKELSFLKVAPENLILSALKKAEKRRSIILRLYNPTKQDIKGNIYFYEPIKKAYQVNLLEKRRTPVLLKSAKKISLTVNKKKIITLELYV